MSKAKQIIAMCMGTKVLMAPTIQQRAHARQCVLCRRLPKKAEEEDFERWIDPKEVAFYPCPKFKPMQSVSGSIMDERKSVRSAIRNSEEEL